MIIFYHMINFLYQIFILEVTKTVIEIWCRDSKNTLLIAKNEIVFFV